MKPKMVAIALLLTAPLAALADEKLQRANVPKAVLDAVQERHPGARQTGYEKENAGRDTRYEVRLAEGADVIEVLVTPEGAIVSEESVIAFDRLPAAVQSAARSTKYAKWSVEKAEKIVREGDAGGTTFELVFKHGDHQREAVFDSSGKLLKDEPVRD